MVHTILVTAVKNQSADHVIFSVGGGKRYVSHCADKVFSNYCLFVVYILVYLKKPKAYYSTKKRVTNRPSRKTFSRHPRYIRRSLKPGRALILLAGRHQGKRVILLKALKSGLLLVTGPFAVNSCPLRRISQRYVIACQPMLIWVIIKCQNILTTNISAEKVNKIKKKFCFRNFQRQWKKQQSKKSPFQQLPELR